MSTIARHLLPDTAEIVGGRLRVGGCDVHDLAAAHGTPLFSTTSRTCARDALRLCANSAPTR